jgi:prepilin-type processing-associated H-X9-DG protein
MCNFLTAIPGIICGAMALSRIGKSQGTLGGKNMAIAGLILSCVLWLLTLPIMAAMVLPAFSRARGAASEVKCQGNVNQLMKAWILYENANRMKPPRTMDDLKKALGGGRSNDDCFICPLADDQSKPSYAIVLGEGKGLDSVPPNTVVIREIHPNHRGKRVLGFADGHVGVEK